MDHTSQLPGKLRATVPGNGRRYLFFMDCQKRVSRKE
jgi:hypothetical protein